MNRKLCVLIVAASAALFGSLGCTAEDGVKTGLTNGISSAISAAITAPVSFYLERTFGQAN